MAKRRMAVMIALICLYFWLTPCYAMAVSTTDASEPINVNQECMLTLTYTCDGTAFEDVSVKLYKIGVPALTHYPNLLDDSSSLV